MTEERHATLEVIAPSVEEAIEKGLNQLGLSRDKVDVKVLDEGNTGLLGLGARQARIMLIVKGPEDIEEETEAEVPAETTPPEQPATEATPEEEGDEEDSYLVDLAQDTVRDLLTKMNIEDVKLETYLGEPYGPHNRVPVHVDIYGDDLSVLIGNRGKTLNAMQYIGRLILGKELERSVPLVLDVEGYRDRREQQVRRMARQVADQVIDTQREKSLEPMPANERRFVHIELRDNEQVYTESQGSGKSRKVFIYPQT
jgi:spoIIIJ-associated protein